MTTTEVNTEVSPELTKFLSETRKKERKTNTIPPAVREYYAAQGRKGGRKGKREDKVRAGKLGHKAQIASLQRKLCKPAEQPKPAETTENKQHE